MTMFKLLHQLFNSKWRIHFFIEIGGPLIFHKLTYLIKILKSIKRFFLDFYVTIAVTILKNTAFVNMSYKKWYFVLNLPIQFPIEYLAGP